MVSLHWLRVILLQLCWLGLQVSARHRLGHFEGDLQLEGGNIEGTGNVLIFYENKYGAICDDGWDLNAADVVCRTLGFPRALGHTTRSYFGKPAHNIVLDDVQCHGDEPDVLSCRHRALGDHDCDKREAAGVFCDQNGYEAPEVKPPPTTTPPSSSSASSSTTTTATTTTSPTSSNVTRRNRNRIGARAGVRGGQQNASSEETQAASAVLEQSQTLNLNASERERLKQIQRLESQANEAIQHRDPRKPPKYELRVTNGRNPREGRVEVSVQGNKWGVICGDHWTLNEAMVACKQLGLGYAQMSVPTADSFGGVDMDKLFAGIECDGEEDRLSDCYHHQINDVICPQTNMVAGVVCTDALPDLVPNATLLETSAYLMDHPMIYLQCAMEENCAAPSAFRIRKTSQDWHIQRRRLFRFSSSTWNFGTADFRPNTPKETWQWHLCHMHYHSMGVFAHYDLLDLHGNRVAEGHKASFCLEDVQCLPGKEKKFECVGFSDQGISVGCADDYLHDIDCQWIDITDVPPGNYVFKVHVNPERMVPELSFKNNAVSCQFYYSGYQVVVRNCTLSNG